ncbi:unnamed protein product [Penicillium nalgiovense]|nr:unnamed protein product [Penicillium nalgiovense]
MPRKDGELTAIKERLRSHAQAFDGLLSLIPAKYYYGEEDTRSMATQKANQRTSTRGEAGEAES